MSMQYTPDMSQLEEPLLTDEGIKEAQVFKIRPHKLTELFEYDNTQYYEKKYYPYKISRSLEMLKKLGNVQQLMAVLKTDPKSGINGDIKDMKRRTEAFGPNIRAPPQIPSPLMRLKQMLLRFYVASIISLSLFLIFSLWAMYDWDTLHTNENVITVVKSCVTIIILCLVGSYMAALSLFLKDYQVRKLVHETRKQNVTTLRGKDEFTINLPSEELVVGDIIFFGKGTRIPADCVIISSKEVFVDESMLGTFHIPVKKEPLTEENFKENPNPFLFNSTIVKQGSGRALVLAVGQNTYVGKKQDELAFEKNPSPTQHRMKNISNQMQQIGIAAASLVMLSILTFEVIYIYQDTDEDIGQKLFIEIIYGAITAVTLVQCVLPESLDHIISFSLIMQIRNKTNQLCNVQASEKLGGAQEILISKSGVLTKHSCDSRIAYFYLNEQFYDTNERNLADIEDSPAKEIFINSVLYNSFEGTLQMWDNEHYIPRGNFVDCCLQWFLLQNNYDVHASQRKLLATGVVQKLGLTNDRMRSTCVAMHGLNQVRVYTKGAPDILLKLCPYYMNSKGEVKPLLEKQRQIILHDTAIDKMAKKHCQVIAIAYKDMALQEYLKLQAVHKLGQMEESEKANFFEYDLIFTSLVAIEDPPLTELKQYVQECKEGGVTLRLVTSDNIFTARAAAIELGIITKEESIEEFVCLEGKDFIKYVGNLKKIEDDFGDIVAEQIPKKIAFQTVCSKLRVLARTTPEVKYALICGLKEEAIIAATGKNNDDLDAMIKSDVGICLSGRPNHDSIKEHSDIIMLNDQLSYVVMSMKWGRALYANARKYLQFSITINASLIMLMVGGNFRGEPQLLPTQILWLNLVMDSIMAIAFATDTPTEAVIKYQKPLSRNENVMTPVIAKNIVILACYQTLVLYFFVFFAPSIMGLEYTAQDGAYDKITGEPTNKTICNTIVFHIMMNMIIVQALVSRKINDEEKNIFKDLFNNRLFNFFLGLTIVLQYSLVTFGGMNFDVTALTIPQHMLCIFYAATIFPVAYLAKFIGNERFARIRMQEVIEEVDLNKLEYERMMREYNSPAIKGALFEEQQRWFIERTLSKRKTEKIKKFTHGRKKSSSFESDEDGLLDSGSENGNRQAAASSDNGEGLRYKTPHEAYYYKLMRKFKYKMY